MRSGSTPHFHIRPGASRAAVVLLGLLLGLSALTGCASSLDESGTSDEGSTTFSFTDDRDESVELEASDVRVVAHEDAAQALMHFGIKPVGIFGGTQMDKNPTLEGLDLDGVESLGEAWGQIKMEKLAELQPDVIVSTFYTGDGVLFPGGVYGFGTKKQQSDAEEIAPILAIKATQPSSSVISRFSELAKALGADVGSGQYADERKAFDAAVEGLKEAASESDQSVLAVTPANDGLYVAVPGEFADTLDLVDWGVNMMEPDGKLASSYYENLSWENAAKYQPDALLIDVRGYTLDKDQLAADYPTWGDMTAVQNDKIGSWSRVSLNYPDYTAQIEELTGVLQGTS